MADRDTESSNTGTRREVLFSGGAISSGIAARQLNFGIWQDRENTVPDSDATAELSLDFQGGESTTTALFENQTNKDQILMSDLYFTGEENQAYYHPGAAVETTVESGGTELIEYTWDFPSNLPAGEHTVSATLVTGNPETSASDDLCEMMEARTLTRKFRVLKENTETWVQKLGESVGISDRAPSQLVELGSIGLYPVSPQARLIETALSETDILAKIEKHPVAVRCGCANGLIYAIQRLIDDVQSLIEDPIQYVNDLVNALVTLLQNIEWIPALIQQALDEFISAMRSANPYNRFLQGSLHRTFNLGWVAGYLIFELVFSKGIIKAQRGLRSTISSDRLKALINNIDAGDTDRSYLYVLSHMIDEYTFEQRRKLLELPPSVLAQVFRDRQWYESQPNSSKLAFSRKGIVPELNAVRQYVKQTPGAELFFKGTFWRLGEDAFPPEELQRKEFVLFDVTPKPPDTGSGASRTPPQVDILVLKAGEIGPDGPIPELVSVEKAIEVTGGSGGGKPQQVTDMLAYYQRNGMTIKVSDKEVTIPGDRFTETTGEVWLPSDEDADLIGGIVVRNELPLTNKEYTEIREAFSDAGILTK